MFRCLYLSRSYAAVKKYAEALSLTQRAHLYLREASSLLSLDADPINAGTPAFDVLTSASFSNLEEALTKDEAQLKSDWFGFNGGSVLPERDPSKKPLFFDIALNYVQLDMDRLQQRAGKAPASATAPVSVKGLADQKPTITKPPAATKAKQEEIERPSSPEPAATARGGLGSLLGGWWGRK